MRKQKESHSQLQRRSTWQKRKAYQSPPNDHHNMSNEWQLNHNNNNQNNNNINSNNNSFNENSFNDSSVFDRLHTASIRNKRHNTSHYDLNSSLNMDQIDNNNDQMLVNNNNNNNNEALRVIAAENEISKKPQRNNNNNNNGNKSLLMNPVRVLTPDA